MSKSNTWESDLLLLVFNNTNAANIGDAHRPARVFDPKAVKPAE